MVGTIHNMYELFTLMRSPKSKLIQILLLNLTFQFARLPKRRFSDLQCTDCDADTYILHGGPHINSPLGTNLSF